MKKAHKIIGLLIVIILVSAVGAWFFGKRPESSLRHVTIGIQTSPAMAIVMVAKDKDFFRNEGLDVELKEFTAGKFALEAFLGGSLDFAISGDVPAALALLQGNSFLVPAQVVRSTKNEVRIVARKDGNNTSPESYFKSKKRKLATSIGGGPEFFTYEFLNALKVSSSQIEIVSQKPGDMPAALSSRSVDAISIFDPFAFIAEKQLKENAITFTNSTIYSEVYIIEAGESVRTDSNTVQKVLKGLIAAEDFTRAHPDEAKRIVAKYTKLDAATIDGIWDNFDFSVSLTPNLLDYWNREVAWAKATGKVSQETKNPDFKKVIFETPLKNIRPAAVQL